MSWIREAQGDVLPLVTRARDALAAGHRATAKVLAARAALVLRRHEDTHGSISSLPQLRAIVDALLHDVGAAS